MTGALVIYGSSALITELWFSLDSLSFINDNGRTIGDERAVRPRSKNPYKLGAVKGGCFPLETC
jgi:hypothetical protein